MTATARILFAIAVIVAGGALLGLERCESGTPVVSLPADLALGRQEQVVRLAAHDAESGLRSLAVVLETAAGEHVLLEQAGGGNWLLGAGDPPLAGEFEIPLSAKALGLQEGEAFLRVTAVDWSWRGGFQGNQQTLRVPLRVDLRPPRISVHNGLTYVRRAGSAAVAYTLSEAAVRDGVEVGDAFFRGFPAAPGADGAQRRIAIFAVPWNAPANPKIRVVAEDAAGNRSSGGWTTRLQEREFAAADVNLPNSFLQNKVPDLAASEGIADEDLVEAFRRINSEVRAANEATIRKAAEAGSEERLFEGAFAQLHNSKVTSRFAEQRSYQIDGQDVSEAVHFGYDLAATAQASITAANVGRVVFADELGIYGQCVILDHGLGVTSLYGHLSRIDVEAGDLVEKGQNLGASGQTGLAGGDHLHFAIQVGGVYVDPLEWWDPKWVRDHVEARFASANR